MALSGGLLGRRICSLCRAKSNVNVLFNTSVKPSASMIVRQMAGGQSKFFISPARFGDWRFVLAIRNYFLIGLIPCGVVITYVNVFVGQAKLAEIPEDYTPEHWEYFKHPITRFIARNFLRSEQQEYEMRAHVLAKEQERRLRRQFDRKLSYVLYTEDDQAEEYRQQKPILYNPDLEKEE